MRIIIILTAFIACAYGQATESIKLVSGNGLYWCEEAATRGKGNIIGSFYGRGFIWDDDSPFRLFPSISGEYGILSWLDVSLSTEIITYMWSVPGEIRLKVKTAPPLENRLRLFNGALSLSYAHNFNKEFPSNGWRYVGDLGFSPEGLRYVGGFIDIMTLGDAELIAWKSFLPLKVYLNAGFRIPTSTDLDNYWQMRLFTGVCYKGLITDFFLEYSLEALEGFKGYRVIEFKRSNIGDFSFPYYFSENPMYITPGFRMKYASGASITVALPILVSQEQGYTASSVRTGEIERTGAKEKGITDGFSPFYADWKLTARLDFPFRYTPVNAEIVRKFMLLKNRKGGGTIDIDEKLKSKSNTTENDEDRIQDELNKQREEILKENLLE